jgi:hypothetical protein
MIQIQPRPDVGQRSRQRWVWRLEHCQRQLNNGPRDQAPHVILFELCGCTFSRGIHSGPVLRLLLFSFTQEINYMMSSNPYRAPNDNSQSNTAISGAMCTDATGLDQQQSHKTEAEAVSSSNAQVAAARVSIKSVGRGPSAIEKPFYSILLTRTQEQDNKEKQKERKTFAEYFPCKHSKDTFRFRCGFRKEGPCHLCHHHQYSSFKHTRQEQQQQRTSETIICRLSHDNSFRSINRG